MIFLLLLGMISALQIKAARALLGWSQQELADRAIVSVNAVNRMERGSVDTKSSTITAVERAINRAGVEFIPAGDKGEGVRFTRPAAAD